MSKYLRPIQKGEYDLVNISMVGFDPNTGESYEDCQAAWSEQRKIVEDRYKKSRWWQFSERREINRQAWALRSHLGM